MWRSAPKRRTPYFALQNTHREGRVRFDAHETGRLSCELNKSRRLVPIAPGFSSDITDRNLQHAAREILCSVPICREQKWRRLPLPLPNDPSIEMENRTTTVIFREYVFFIRYHSGFLVPSYPLSAVYWFPNTTFTNCENRLSDVESVSRNTFSRK